MAAFFKKIYNLALCLLLGHKPGEPEVTGIYFGARHTMTTCKRCGTELLD